MALTREDEGSPRASPAPYISPKHSRADFAPVSGPQDTKGGENEEGGDSSEISLDTEACTAGA